MNYAADEAVLTIPVKFRERVTARLTRRVSAPP
jgi:hypothetical protein